MMKKANYSVSDQSAIALTCIEPLENEKPSHTVFLSGFYIDKFEVTTTQYASFLKETGLRPPNFWKLIDFEKHNQHPVIGISWVAANHYCTHYGKSLPTEAQWEKAARGVDQRLFPWGNNPPTSEHAHFHSVNEGYDIVKPVGSKYLGASFYGAYDMAGNVSEWVADWYGENYYSNSPNKNPKGPENGKSKIYRGGNFYEAGWYIRSTFRVMTWAGHSNSMTGFRCAQSIN